MASTIHRNVTDAIDHAKVIASKDTSQSYVVFWSVPSKLYAVLPYEVASRLYLKNTEAIRMVARVSLLVHGNGEEEEVFSWVHPTDWEIEYHANS